VFVQRVSKNFVFFLNKKKMFLYRFDVLIKNDFLKKIILIYF